MPRKSIARKRKENLTDFFENGPRLSYKRNTWIEAKSPDGNYVLLGGLGAFGIGEMWFRTRDDHRADPEYAKAPVVVPAKGDTGFTPAMAPVPE